MRPRAHLSTFSWKMDRQTDGQTHPPIEMRGASKNYEGKACTINFIKTLDVKKDKVYEAISRAEAGKSHKQQTGAWKAEKAHQTPEK